MSPTRRRAASVAGVLSLTLLLGGAGVLAGASTPTAATPSVTVAVTPHRILDTRDGTGTGGVVGPVGADRTITLQVAGVGPVPLGVTGAVLNVTATEGTAPSFVSAWPTGEPRPTASILNVNPGLNLPNMITVALSVDGRLDLYNLAGAVHLVADVAGYLIPGGGVGPPGPPGPPGVPPQQTLELVAYGAVGQASPAGLGCMTLDESTVGATARLSLPLPAGAVITAARARYRDIPGSASISIELHQVTGFVGGVSASDSVVSAVFTSSGTTNGDVAVLNLNANLAPVSDSTMYYLRAFITAVPLAGLELCGASVDYTLA
jgi:hypothetical protein